MNYICIQAARALMSGREEVSRVGHNDSFTVWPERRNAAS